jgi:carboxyl-terminal processing protease
MVPGWARSLLIPLILLAPLPAAAGSPLGCGDLGKLISHYLSRHVTQRKLDPGLQERVARNYLKRVDPQRSLFLASEADSVTASLVPAVQAIRRGECEALHQLSADIGKRLAGEEALVRTMVSRDGYAVDTEAELVLDPDQRGWPEDPAARDALLRVLVDFQVTNYLNAELELLEARDRIMHRYELRNMHWGEQEPAELYSGFLDAFASTLDPHSGYLSADDLEDFQIGMQLSLEGIGVALSERDGYAVVEQVIPGGAADRLDVLRPKDKIIAVAEAKGEFVSVIDMRLRDIVRLIRGKKGSQVRLVVLRQGEKTERFEVAIERDKINLEEQAAKLRFEDVERGGRALKLAVIELPSFYGDRDPRKRQGSRDVARILAEAREAEADGVLLDLSRNGGGLLEDAVRISGFFLREGGIVGVRGTGEPSRVLDDPDDGILWSGPLVVLISRVSASASEILAGALKDYGRAVIVGDDHSFGKGTVQSVFPLRSGLGALKVTTALFFRPGGASTQNDGVPSDVLVPSPFSVGAFGEKTHTNALPSQAISPFLSRSANGGDEEERWTAVTPTLLTELQTRSTTRQSSSDEFQELRQKLEERENDNGVVILQEIIANGGETEGSAEASAAGVEGEEEARTPQLEEALRVLADQVLLQGISPEIPILQTGIDTPS